MKPIIGITASMEVDGEVYKVHQDHVQAVTKAGGIPFLIPYLMQDKQANLVAAQLDGLYLTGGYDIDPTLFGEEPQQGLGTIIPDRDQFEFMLIRQFLQLDKPILGICRGCQMLNIALGGDMYQDIYGQMNGTLLQHQQNAPTSHRSHFVEVVKDSLLHQLTGQKRLKVNSRHHQANRKVSAPLVVCGKASDGVIEAVESWEHAFVLGVQWHPENMLAVNDIASFNIFKGFLDQAKKGRIQDENH